MSKPEFFPFGLRISAATSMFVVATLVLLFLSACGGGSGGGTTPPPVPISVSVASSSAMVDGNDTVNLTATVSNDSSNSGVTWAAPSIGSLSSTTSTTPTYTAPSATSSSQSVTLTATSAADKSKSSSVTLTIPVAPTITTSSLPSFAAGAAYSTTLSGAGGIGPYTWKLIGGAWPAGLSLNASTGVVSAAVGATAATPATPLTFQLTDSGTPTALTATTTLNLTINPPPSAPVAGSVVFTNACGPVVGPSVSLSINTSPVQTTTTDSNGNFSFASVPLGTFTITPSLSHTNAIFSPATQSVTVGAGGAIANFNAAVGYAVSGNVNYGGSAAGPIVLDLQYNCPNGETGIALGATIHDPGPFTIHGAAPGNYTVMAWRDALTNGWPNAVDPSGSSSPLTVSSADATGLSIELADPASAAFNSTTSSPFAIPIDQGVVLQTNELTESYNQISSFWRLQPGANPELATSYLVQWSSDPSFGSILGSRSYPATGGGILIVNGLLNGQVLYFRYQGVQGSTTSPWSSLSFPVTVGEPAGSVTVTGNVTFANAATGPLYVSFQNLATGAISYVEVANPVSPQAYSIQLPATGNYSFNAFIDQNTDNRIDDGDMILTSLNGVFNIAITGSSATQDITLQGGGNSLVQWQTQNNQCMNCMGTTKQNYEITVYAWDGSKKLEGIELTSGPNTIVPQDFSRGYFVPDFSFLTGFNLLQGATPKVGDAYGFKLTYSDGSSENASYTVASVPDSFGPDPSPSGIGTSLTPSFSWTDPANANDYGYRFSTSSGWMIPGNGWGDFSSSIDSITWGVDPTGGSDLPPSNLFSGDAYTWEVTAIDSSDNASNLNVGYYPGYSQLNLPTANPATLGAATVGQSYSGTIVASNGSSSETFAVTGLSDGLSYSSSGDTLTISGTPLAAGAITFQVSVWDATGAFWGPVTYTINVGN